MIEPQALRIVFEQQGGADLVLGKAIRSQNAGMLQRFQELELAERRALDGLAFLRRGTGANPVESHASLRLGNLCVSGPPILVSGPFTDELLQHVVADFTAALRRADTG